MLKNYLLVAFRNLSKNKAFSFINIVGLAIGMAACLLILQYVSFELSFDNFNVKKDRIYRINQDRYNNGKLSTQWAGGAFAPGSAFKTALSSRYSRLCISVGVNPIATSFVINKCKGTCVELQYSTAISVHSPVPICA